MRETFQNRHTTQGCFNGGFSTLELMLAFAIMSIALAGAVLANGSAEYWLLTTESGASALNLATTQAEEIRAIAAGDFYAATSSPLMRQASAECDAVGLCYFSHTIVGDVSSCVKNIETRVSWQIAHYPTSTISLISNAINPTEVIALGGDCLTQVPVGEWASTTLPHLLGSLVFNPGKGMTGIDVLSKKIYITATTSPYLAIFAAPNVSDPNPVLLGSSDVANIPLNAVDVITDFSSGRVYAFVAQHSTSSQLGVVDVTDPSHPTLVAQRQLLGTAPPSGSYPQGWRLRAYGGRLYIVTRETAGYEFHIFNITNPTQPVELGSGKKLNRTVTDIVVRDEKVNGILRRFVFLAAEAAQKELGVLEVTNDTVVEVSSVDLPGNQDGESVAVLGNRLYFGRASNASGPELYLFDISDPTVNLSEHITGTAEVGANVFALRASGEYLFAGTSKIGQQLQIWNSDVTSWSSTTANVGRISAINFPHLVANGIDIDEDWLYAVDNTTPSDVLNVYSAP